MTEKEARFRVCPRGARNRRPITFATIEDARAAKAAILLRYPDPDKDIDRMTILRRVITVEIQEMVSGKWVVLEVDSVEVWETY